MILTDENRHTAPALMAADRGHKMFIEKPLATDARESAQILKAITEAESIADTFVNQHQHDR